MVSITFNGPELWGDAALPAPTGHLLRALVAEFIGALLLVYSGLLTSVLRQPGEEGSRLPLPGADPYAAAVWGAAAGALTLSLGPVSGAHLQPAVTMAVLVGGEMKWWTAALYIAAQTAGAVAAAALVIGSLPYGAHGSLEEFSELATNYLGGSATNSSLSCCGGAHRIEGVSHGHGVLSSAVVACLMCLVYLRLGCVGPLVLSPDRADSGSSNLAPSATASQEGRLWVQRRTAALQRISRPEGGLAVGLAVFVAQSVVGRIDGGSAAMPTRALAAALVGYRKEQAWRHQWVFWTGPAIGAVLAAVLHRLLRGSTAAVRRKEKKDPGGLPTGGLPLQSLHGASAAAAAVAAAPIKQVKLSFAGRRVELRVAPEHTQEDLMSVLERVFGPSVRGATVCAADGAVTVLSYAGVSGGEHYTLRCLSVLPQGPALSQSANTLNPPTQPVSQPQQQPGVLSPQHGQALGQSMHMTVRTLQSLSTLHA
eukprot:TRINITY_DN61040_c0_g1_i1.p1 TRINITY_DN61040_c0_g1~~TRINITY_DN61040_c0_g1_i1.p1  ORF type:complete len:482 (+),score=103.54 TRINITY_DN61040_c0_g1_i1:80-1525(+)